MSKAYVVDASVFAPLMIILGRELRDVMRRYEFHMLDLTPYEVCNAFWKESLKLGKLPAEDAVTLCRLAVKLSEYAVIHRLAERNVEKLMEAALNDSVTVYDASYLELAAELGVPVASNDKDILVNASKHGVRAYGLKEFIRVIQR